MPDLFERLGGHRQAAGVTLPSDKIDLFRARFKDHATAESYRQLKQSVRGVSHADVVLPYGAVVNSPGQTGQTMV
jgi:single-stranded DNA-specific DHH superfamily exonuclease